jgi:hypothetical protein
MSRPDGEACDYQRDEHDSERNLVITELNKRKATSIVIEAYRISVEETH